MNISIIGAAGNIGRETAIGIIREKFLEKNDTLQLVGRKGSNSERLLPGLRIDIADSYAEIMPNIEIATVPEDVRGDIIIMVGGASLSKSKTTSRDDLARQNGEIFYSYASHISKNCNKAIVIVITNPVELGVHIFCKYLPSNQVIGMGAYLDTLRFQNELAHEFHVRRNRVHGLVLGEHGTGIVPIWSSVKIYGLEDKYSRKRIDEFIKKRHKHDLHRHLERICKLIDQGQIEKFYESFYRFGPDSRIFLGPLISNFTGARTIAGATGATIRLLRTIMSSNIDLAACQVKLNGEFLGIYGIIGAPVFICNNGIFKVEKLNNLLDTEINELIAVSEMINDKLKRWE